jgi:hypothetical protein
VLDDGSSLKTMPSSERDRVVKDGKTGKPVADITRYTYRDADTRYVVSFEREETILQAIFTDRMPLLKRIVARMIGFDGAYHRFTGKVTIEKQESPSEAHALIWFSAPIHVHFTSDHRIRRTSLEPADRNGTAGYETHRWQCFPAQYRHSCR